MICINMIKRNRNLFYHLQPKAVQANTFHRIIGKQTKFPYSEAMQNLGSDTIVPGIHFSPKFRFDLFFTEAFFLESHRSDLVENAVFIAHLIHVEYNTTI